MTGKLNLSEHPSTVISGATGADAKQAVTKYYVDHNYVSVENLAASVATNEVITKKLTATPGNTGVISGSWTLASGSTLQSTYADYYEADKEYDAGTVMVFGGNKEVTNSTTVNDTKVAGVVTTDPAYVMNINQTGIKSCIALAGRVPCKVIGKTKKGDLLTTSNSPGYAIKALDPKLGSIIGKALENKDYGEAGIIEISVWRS